MVLFLVNAGGTMLFRLQHGLHAAPDVPGGGNRAAQRHRYTDAKTPFWEIMQKAERRAAETGWEPGRSDA